MKRVVLMSLCGLGLAVRADAAPVAEAAGAPPSPLVIAQASGAEPRPAGERRRTRMMEMLDQNGDDVLDEAEFLEASRLGGAGDTETDLKARAARFDRLDADDDGVLTRDELPDTLAP